MHCILWQDDIGYTAFTIIVVHEVCVMDTVLFFFFEYGDAKLSCSGMDGQLEDGHVHISEKYVVYDGELGGYSVLAARIVRRQSCVLFTAHSIIARYSVTLLRITSPTEDRNPSLGQIWLQMNKERARSVKGRAHVCKTISVGCLGLSWSEPPIPFRLNDAPDHGFVDLSYGQGLGATTAQALVYYIVCKNMLTSSESH